MASVPRKSTRCRYESAADWPSTPEIDGYVWNVAPEPDDARWAAETLNTDFDDEGPAPDDPVWDRMADEAAAQDLMERGLLL